MWQFQVSENERNKSNLIREKIENMVIVGNASYHSVQTFSLLSCRLKQVNIKMCITKVLSIALEACGTCSLTLKGEQRTQNEGS
jgi:hypothetical protein